jgi:hypothetical protein
VFFIPANAMDVNFLHHFRIGFQDLADRFIAKEQMPDIEAESTGKKIFTPKIAGMRLYHWKSSRSNRSMKAY